MDGIIVKRALAALLALAAFSNSAAAGELSAQAINEAKWSSWADTDAEKENRAFIAALQVQLDRAGFSVSVIDGYAGENLRKAVSAYQAARGEAETGEPGEALWNDLRRRFARPFMTEYSLTDQDLEGPFYPDLPEDYAKLARLDQLGYADVVEMLAERFHMDRDLLEALNRNANFAEAGTTIHVADPGRNIEDTEIVRIRVDKADGSVRGYDKSDRLVVHYPATIGSKTNPSPSGTHKVLTVAMNPTYSYDPDTNFKQGDNTEPLTIPPGPNGPVGSVWIDLSEPTYGIHGTAEPALIDKNNSHGCVRLTNWDAEELARIVTEGASVQFSEN